MSNRKHLRYTTPIRVNSHSISFDELFRYNTHSLHKAMIFCTGFSYYHNLMQEVHKDCCARFFREFSLPKFDTYKDVDSDKFRRVLCSIISDFLHSYALNPYNCTNHSPYMFLYDSLFSFRFPTKLPNGFKYYYDLIILDGFVACCNHLHIPVVKLFCESIDVDNNEPMLCVRSLLRKYSIIK